MTHYRIYTLTANGRIVSGSDLTVPTDDAAIDHCATIANCDGIEIWQGARLVKSLPPSAAAIASQRMTVAPPRQN